MPWTTALREIICGLLQSWEPRDKGMLLVTTELFKGQWILLTSLSNYFRNYLFKYLKDVRGLQNNNFENPSGEFTFILEKNKNKLKNSKNWE